MGLASGVLPRQSRTTWLCNCNSRVVGIVFGSDGRTVATVEAERHGAIGSRLPRIAGESHSRAVDPQQTAGGRLVRRHAHGDVDFAVGIERLGSGIELRFLGANQVGLFTVLVEELQFHSIEFDQGGLLDRSENCGRES